MHDRHHEFGLHLGLIEAREGSSGIGWLEVCCCQPPSNITMDVTLLKLNIYYVASPFFSVFIFVSREIEALQ